MNYKHNEQEKDNKGRFKKKEEPLTVEEQRTKMIKDCQKQIFENGWDEPTRIKEVYSMITGIDDNFPSLLQMKRTILMYDDQFITLK
jgi:hypothetical protein